MPSQQRRNGAGSPGRRREQVVELVLGQRRGEGEHALGRVGAGRRPRACPRPTSCSEDPALGRELDDVLEHRCRVEVGGEPDLADPPAPGQQQLAHGLAALDLLAAEPTGVPTPGWPAAGPRVRRATGRSTPRCRDAAAPAADRAGRPTRRTHWPVDPDAAADRRRLDCGRSPRSAAPDRFGRAALGAGRRAISRPRLRSCRLRRHSDGSITATAQQAMPSPRPSAPRPSGRRPFTVTGAPTAVGQPASASRRGRGASLGARRPPSSRRCPAPTPRPAPGRRPRPSRSMLSAPPRPGRCRGSASRCRPGPRRRAAHRRRRGRPRRRRCGPPGRGRPRSGRRRARAAGRGRRLNGWTSKPCPTRTSISASSTTCRRSAAPRRAGRRASVILQVPRLALHDHAPCHRRPRPAWHRRWPRRRSAWAARRAPAAKRLRRLHGDELGRGRRARRPRRRMVSTTAIAGHGGVGAGDARRPPPPRNSAVAGERAGRVVDDDDRRRRRGTAARPGAHRRRAGGAAGDHRRRPPARTAATASARHDEHHAVGHRRGRRRATSRRTRRPAERLVLLGPAEPVAASGRHDDRPHRPGRRHGAASVNAGDRTRDGTRAGPARGRRYRAPPVACTPYVTTCRHGGHRPARRTSSSSPS